MRAVMCRQFGPPESLTVEEVDDPRPGGGEVVIDVHACGVNFPDVLIIEDKYQFKPPLPFSPGSEVAGVVAELGDGVEGVSVGDRVVALAGWGGFAGKVAVNAAAVTPVSASMDLTTASVLVFAYGTSLYALKDRAHLREGETLLVLGAAGGVGLAAVEIGKRLGARVIAAASTQAKLEVCRERGADETVNYSDTDLRARLKELTGGRGVDVVYDPVGGAYSEPALRSIAWEGRFLVIGFAAGDIPRIPLNLPLLKGCQIVGVFWGAFAGREPAANRENLQQLMTWWEQGAIRPHLSAVYPLERAAEALREMSERRVMGKIAVVTQSR